MSAASLRAEIATLGDKLGVAVDAEKLTRKELEAKARELRAMPVGTDDDVSKSETIDANEPSAHAGDDSTPDDEPTTPDDVPGDSAATYVVAPGKSLVCARGVLTEGHEFRQEFLARGTSKDFDDLVAKGYVVQAAKPRK